MIDNPLIQSLKELSIFLEEEGIGYMLVGGLAVGLWSQPRATVDVDLLVSFSVDDFESLRQKLGQSERFVFIHEEPIVFEKIALLRATLKSHPSVSVDFLFADDAFKNEALQRKETIQLEGFTLNIPAPEDLILLKLLSDRPQDRLDAEMIYKAQKKGLDKETLRRRAERLGIDIPFLEEID